MTKILRNSTRWPIGRAAIAGAAFLMLIPQAPAQNDPVRLDYRYAFFGWRIGEDGTTLGDVDADGTPDIICSASDHYWFVAQAAGDGYEMAWASWIFQDELTSLTTADANDDERSEVYAIAGNRLYVYDGWPPALTRTLLLPTEDAIDLRVLDVDADGNFEVVFFENSPNRLYIVDLDSGQTEYSTTVAASDRIAIGNVDADAALEVVFSGQPGIVIDGATHQIEWSYSSGFSSRVAVGDIDLDGMDEIIASGWPAGSVFDVDTRSVKYTFSTSRPQWEFCVADLDSVGLPELVVGMDSGVSVLEGSNGAERFSIPSFREVQAVVAGDVNADGAAEIFVTATEAAGLKVIDPQLQQISWASPLFGPPFTAFDCGDVDHDNRPDWVHIASISGSTSGEATYFISDAATGAVIRQGPIQMRAADAFRVRAANVDGDPQDELFVPGYNVSGIVACYDSQTDERQWTSEVISGVGFRALVVADLDSDGALELIGGHDPTSTASPALSFVVWDAATGVERWRAATESLYFSAALLRVANVDDDPQLEIIAGNNHSIGEGGEIEIWDALTHQRQLQTADLGINALDVFDTDGDGIATIFIGTWRGLLATLDASTGLIEEPLGYVGRRIDGLAIGYFAGGPDYDIAFGVNSQLRLFYDVPGGRTYWVSENLDLFTTQLEPYQQHDNILARDVDWDGYLELVVNNYYVGFTIFELPETYCLADLNGDRVGNIADLAMLLANFGNAVDFHFQGDIDADGVVSVADLALLLANFGMPCGVPTP